MAGVEELMSRLQQLEDGYYGDKEAARQQAFFDRYGGRFSNDHGLGLAILNELDARGIDTSAADEALNQILDQLRTECSQIVDLIKDVQDKAIDTEKKVDTIQDVVQEHVSSNPDASVSSEPGDIGGEEFNPDEMGEAPAPDMGGAPVPDAGAPAPAPDMGAMPLEGGEPPADMGAMPPEGGDMGTPMPEEPAPQGIVSDERLKNIRRAYGRVRERRSGFKPSAAIIACARGE